MSPGPPTRTVRSTGPTALDGVTAIDRYLRALDGSRGRPNGALEDEFVEHALIFARRKGITYGAWRDVGVPAHVLARAGIAVDAPPR